MKRVVLGLLLLVLAACTPATKILPTVDASPTVENPTPKPTSEKPLLAVTPTPQPLSEADAFTFQQNHKIGRGVNLGNALEAPNEGDWGVVLEEEYFDLIKEAGFNSVRIPVRWSSHAEEKAPYTISPAFFERVDWAVEQALSRGLVVVLNMHHYLELMEDPLEHQERFLALWRQIAEHYKAQPEGLFFEPLNEPNGTLSMSWSKLANEALAVIRESNPQRMVVIGPADWNNLNYLYDLKLPPEDRNIIVTFHYYLPFQFTHQGAEWADGSQAWLGTKWEGSEGSKRAILRDFDLARLWSQQNERPLYLGEFGAYSKADIESRQRWTAFVARSAEEYGFSWAYWEFCAGFGVYDSGLKTWNEPIRRALIP